MKQKIIKILTVTLALLVLFSTFSFTVEKHYCGDFLVDVSYLGQADTCNLGSDIDCGNVIKRKKCCKNEVHHIDGQDEIQKVSLEKIDFHQIKIFPAPYTLYELLFQDFEKQLVSYKDYSPPDIVFSVQIFYDVFII